MVELQRNAVVRIVPPTRETIAVRSPGVHKGVVYHEGPPGPRGEDGFLIAVSDEAPGGLVEGGIYYDTDDPGIDGSEFVMRVLYNGAPYPARPPVVYVEWVGPVQPTDAIDGDTWIDTT